MKKTIISIFACLILGCSIIGCNTATASDPNYIEKWNDAKQAEAQQKVEEEYQKKLDIVSYSTDGTNFETISPNLIYDEETKIVYYFIKSYSPMESYYFNACPYYSENGKLCRYNEQEQKIEEIK